jgi:hypothetical protein
MHRSGHSRVPPEIALSAIRLLANECTNRGIAECLYGRFDNCPPGYGVATLPAEAIVPKRGGLMGQKE